MTSPDNNVAMPANETHIVNGLGPPRTTAETSQQILDIIFEYALNKFDDSRERLEKGADNFLVVIGKFVEDGLPVEACLPAFPFKSANKVYKVLGNLPDKAEELALERLHSMCRRIQEVYPPGARVTIISDGITYNDLLCISDQETWAYGESLRTLSQRKGFTNVAFSRIKDILDIPLPQKLTEVVYVANCTAFRRHLLNRYSRPDYDVDAEIASNVDTRLTYQGYRRFLESDLKHIFPQGPNRSANEYKRNCGYLAKQMLARGDAFARAIKAAFPSHLRLSIHESEAGVKLSICLLNTKTGFTTPWHCSVAQLANGDWVSAPMGEFMKDDRLEVAYEDGRPSHFREKSGAGEGVGLTASYLQVARPLSSSEYRSGASTPAALSPGMVSQKFSPKVRAAPSDVPTPETQSLVETQSITESIPDEAVPYGRRLIPQILDALAQHEPQKTVFTLTEVVDGSVKTRDVSALDFTKAVDKTAWWIHDQIGQSASIQPIGYIGPHDLRHILLTYASVKAGYAALFLSPKNNTEGALAVLKATDCNVWATASDAPSPPLVKDILDQRPMKLLQLPPLNDLLGAATEPFPYTKTFDDAKDEPFCFLHTSGTTGVPKPIPWSHSLIGTMDAIRLLPPVEGDYGLSPWTTDWKPGDTIYSSFPMSHGAGIIMDILMPALFDLRCVLGPAGVLPNINLVETLADSLRIDIWSMVPSLVDELGETPDVLAKLRPSKFICASGGPVHPASAGKVNDVVRVLNLTGTTEGLFIGNLVTSREDWFWFCFHPYSGFEFREVEEGTHEHWVHKTENWPLFQGIFHTFPEKESINFKDLYRRHPTKPYLWSFKGRSDDLVVLSNGYKISPLETEAFITTHPAVSGCLIFGTGRPQAGLLVELKDPCSKSEEVLDSIWETIKKANATSRHKDQLLKDFVTFSEGDKPFIRTDKGTIKRQATLALYEQFIERFYSSRDDDSAAPLDIDSAELIQPGLRKIFLSHVSGEDLTADRSLFELGLDSLGVFASVKAIRASTGLGDRIAPRHVYANPTLASLSSVILRLMNESKGSKTPTPAAADDIQTRIADEAAQHKARQSFPLNALDYVNPNHGMGFVWYLPLQEDANHEQVFQNLQDGLNRTFDMIPALGGKIAKRSEHEFGYVKGDLCVTIPPLSMAKSVHNRLVYKDLSDVLPSFDQMRQANFAPHLFPDGLVVRDDPFPALPADIFVGQVNFVKGGCILAVDLNHTCMDGVGAVVAVKAWAENCRYLQGDESATCEWLDPESFNHSLPEIIHHREGWERAEVDQSVWDLLPFFPPGVNTKHAPALPSDLPVIHPTYGFPLHNVWPLPRAERCMKTTMFALKPDSIKKLRQDVAAEGVNLSTSDIIQALFWRSAIRSRYRVAKEIRKQTFPPGATSILELPTDTRPHFSSLLPSSYMGSMLIMNRLSMDLETLCSPATSIGQIALQLRGASSRITPPLVHDALALLQSDRSGGFSTANMGLEHMNAMISNMMLFETSEVRFGEKFFAGEGGGVEALRPQVDRGNGRFRFLVITPMTREGGVELLMGTHEEELEMLMGDEEFTRYAELLDGREN